MIPSTYQSHMPLLRSFLRLLWLSINMLRLTAFTRSIKAKRHLDSAGATQLT